MKAFCETKLLALTFFELYGLVLQTRKILLIFAIFSSFLKIMSFFEVWQLKGPRILIHGLIIGQCIVYCDNRLVFNILMSRILAFFK